MSGLTIADLVASPSFKVSPIAGEAYLNNDVTWLHISSTRAITPWIESGDLVLTSGYNLPANHGAQIDLMRSLVRRGAAALAIGGLSAPDDLGGLIAGADEFGLPLLQISVDVSWGALGRAVADANDSGMRASLRNQIRIFESLQARLQGSLGFPETLQFLSVITNHDLYLVNTMGLPAFANLKPLPDHLRYALQSATRWTRDGFSIPIELGNERVATLITEQNSSNSSGLTALLHVATIAATEMVDLERQRSVERRNGSSLYLKLKSRSLSAEAAVAGLREFGLIGPYRVVRFYGSSSAVDGASRALADCGASHLVEHSNRGGEILVGRVDKEIWRQISSITDSPLGLSRTFEAPGNLGIASQQAEWALQRSSGSAPDVCEFDAPGTLVHWLPADRADLESLVEAVLGPLLKFDESRTELVTTLRSYLRHDRAVTAVARELLVHRQTVNYRLKRIGMLTGRKLNSVDGTAELWLALNAYDALNANPQSSDKPFG